MSEIESLENWSLRSEEAFKGVKRKAGLVLVRLHEGVVCEAAPWEASELKGIECHLLCEAAQVIVQENCGIKLLTLSSHIETFGQIP